MNRATGAAVAASSMTVSRPRFSARNGKRDGPAAMAAMSASRSPVPWITAGHSPLAASHTHTVLSSDPLAIVVPSARSPVVGRPSSSGAPRLRDKQDAPRLVGLAPFDRHVLCCAHLLGMAQSDFDVELLSLRPRLGSPLSSDQPLVFVVGTDPDPDEVGAVFDREGAVGETGPH